MIRNQTKMDKAALFDFVSACHETMNSNLAAVKGHLPEQLSGIIGIVFSDLRILIKFSGDKIVPDNTDFLVPDIRQPFDGTCELTVYEKSKFNISEGGLRI